MNEMKEERFSELEVLIDFYVFLQQSKAVFEMNYGQPSKSSPRISDFNVIRTIGSGSFSNVLLTKSVVDETYHAIKVMSKGFLVSISAAGYALRERHIIRAISFPFIVPVESTFQDNSNLYICMPFIPGGDLFSVLRRHDRFSEKTAMFYVAQVVLCLEYLHYLNVVYRDLKPENILIDEVGYIRLTDFGFSKKLSGRTHTFCGTPEYMAPEIILGKGYGKGVDWWALGVMTYEMVAGRVPFQASEPMKLYEIIVRGGDLTYPLEFSPALRNFVQGLIEPEPTRRLGNLKNGAEQVKLHPWLTSTDWVAILDKTVVPPITPRVKGPSDDSNYDVFDDIDLNICPDDKFTRFFQGF